MISVEITHSKPIMDLANGKKIAKAAFAKFTDNYI